MSQSDGHVRVVDPYWARGLGFHAVPDPYSTPARLSQTCQGTQHVVAFCAVLIPLISDSLLEAANNADRYWDRDPCMPSRSNGSGCIQPYAIGFGSLVTQSDLRPVIKALYGLQVHPSR